MRCMTLMRTKKMYNTEEHIDHWIGVTSRQYMKLIQIRCSYMDLQITKHHYNINTSGQDYY